MTTPDTATIARELRQIARTVRGEAQLNEPGWPLRLERLAEQLAVIAEQLRGQTLVTLPAPDETSPDRWFREAGNVEIDPNSCRPGAVWIRDLAHSPTEAYELGLALLAAAERAAGLQETAVLPPERHSPGQTGHGEGPNTPDKLNEALRATGIKVEDVDPVALREALVQASGPPWGQGRGAYLAGLLGEKLAEDKRTLAASTPPDLTDVTPGDVTFRDQQGGDTP